VVAEGDLYGGREEGRVSPAVFDGPEGLAAGGGVALHDGALLVRQGARLAEDGVGRGDLADIVQRGGGGEGADGGGIRQQAAAEEFAAQDLGVRADALQVLAGLVIAGIGEFGEAEDHGVTAADDLRALLIHFGLEIRVQVGKGALQPDDALSRGETDAEFFAVEGLGEEIVSAGLHAGDDVGLFRAAGQDDDEDVAVRAAVADAADEVGPAEAGHLPVGEDEVEIVLGEVVPGLGAVLYGGDGVAPAFEFTLERGAGDAFIFGEEDVHGGSIVEAVEGSAGLDPGPGFRTRGGRRPEHIAD